MLHLVIAFFCVTITFFTTRFFLLPIRNQRLKMQNDPPRLHRTTSCPMLLTEDEAKVLCPNQGNRLLESFSVQAGGRVDYCFWIRDGDRALRVHQESTLSAFYKEIWTKIAFDTEHI